MKTSIVRIGNSRGVRIPKALLEKCGLQDFVELEAEAGRLVIKAATRPRAGWDAAFREMGDHGDDQILYKDSEAATEWDRTEWEWE